MAETTQCKACKKEVALEAETCPHCGQSFPGRSWKDVGDGCLGMIIFAIVGIIILAIIVTVMSHK